MSDPGRAKQVLDVCDQALLLAPDKREEFLECACQGNAALKESVVLLLQAIDDSGSFLQVDEKDSKKSP